MQSLTKSNITSLKDLWFNIATDLVASGAMTLESTYYDSGNGTPNYASQSSTPSIEGLLYVFAPSLTLDANSEDQPWRIVVKLTETYYDIWVVTPTQIIQDASSFSISRSGDEPKQESGLLTPYNLTEDNHFFSRTSESTWSSYDNVEDTSVIPLTYHISCGDHGIVFSTWAEGHDKSGDSFNWFVVQRSVDSSGQILKDVTNSKDPLFCVFSKDGGGSYNVDTIEPLGILKFVVREQDINAPTVPQSAVVPSADSSALFNPIQQVSTSESGKFIISFPRGLNTQRYRYATELDMVAYVSADVIAHATEIPVTLYGSPRKYKALNANHLNNKGMRLLVQIP